MWTDPGTLVAFRCRPDSWELGPLARLAWPWTRTLAGRAGGAAGGTDTKVVVVVCRKKSLLFAASCAYVASVSQGLTRDSGTKCVWRMGDTVSRQAGTVLAIGAWL